MSRHNMHFVNRKKKNNHELFLLLLFSLVLNSHICSVFSSGGSQRLEQCDMLTCMLSFWSITW